jgi:outer membrane protein TolC
MVLGEYERDAAGEESGGVASSLGFNWLLPNGTRLVLSLANNFSQFFTGDRRELAMTILQGNVTQPVLRGFNREVVTEPLVQAERDLLYQVRAFERFRQTFAVRVVTEFYRVLQERDRVTNEYRNWQDLVQDTARVADLAEAGILATLELDQSRQQELQAKDRYFAAVQRYESALDGFKITLSIPVDEAVGLDPGELEKLAAQEVRALESPLADAVAVALDLRLDVLNARGEVEDTERRIRVVADSLRTQLDLNASASLASKDTRPLKFNGDEVSYGLGFTLDLPLDRKAERNDYVAALIAHESQKRERSLLEDNVRLTVRDAHRALDRETVTYGIQKASVALAEERVESTSLLRQAGRAETRDVLESLSALIEARNALTASLVNYTIARLEFFRDTGALKVSGDGTVTELALRVEAHD